MTDNASEAAKMIPRVTRAAVGGLVDGGGLLEHSFFFCDAFERVPGLGWRCRSSESDIREGERVVVGSVRPQWWAVYTSVSQTHRRILIRKREISLQEGKRESQRWYFPEDLHTKTF